MPLGIHADKGQHISRDKMLCVSWGSVTHVAPTLWGKILFTICPDELLIKQETAEQLYALLVWSLQWLMLGIWPDKDPDGNPWPPGSRRAAMAGRPLAEGYCGLFADSRGDWEWQVETFLWRSQIRERARDINR